MVAGLQRAHPSTSLDKSAKSSFILNWFLPENKQFLIMSDIVSRIKKSVNDKVFPLKSSKNYTWAVLEMMPVAFSIACSKSSIKSSAFSIPIDTRIRSSGTPAAASPSASSCWWVVLAG